MRASLLGAALVLAAPLGFHSASAQEAAAGAVPPLPPVAAPMGEAPVPSHAVGVRTWSGAGMSGPEARALRVGDPFGAAALRSSNDISASGEAAQAVSAGDPWANPSVDATVLRAVYRLDAPFSTAFRALNATAYPAFAAVPAGLAAHAALTGGSYRPALRAGLSEAVVVVVVTGAKAVVRRPRPYTALPGIEDRAGGVSARASMPSGHSALAFAAATSLALSHPRAAVAVPAYTWATGVALARVWHGVHYPSDVLVGALVGAGAAYGVHRLLPDPRAKPAPGAASVEVSLGRVAVRF